jgi:uncharacterized protein (TIGR00369 family)
MATNAAPADPPTGTTTAPTHTGAAVTDEPVRGGSGEPGLASLPGMHALRTWVEGRSPQPPLARLTGRRLTAVDIGAATYRLPVSPWLLGPKGRVHPGVLTFLAGAPLFAAVQSTLPPRTSCTTAELSLTFLGDPPGGPGDLIAAGRIVATAGDTGLSEVRITGEGDRLVAFGTARCLIFPPAAEASPFLGVPHVEPQWKTPDPWERPLPEPPAEVPGDMSGLELLSARLHGQRPPPPIDRLTGTCLLEASDGRVVFAMPASGWLCQEFGAIFGGAIALLGLSAASAAVQTTADAGTAFAALDVKVNLLHPVLPDDQDLVATGTVLHRGRRLAIGTSEVRHGHRRVAVVTGTTQLIPR